MTMFDSINNDLKKIRLLDFYDSIESAVADPCLNIYATKILAIANRHGTITDTGMGTYYDVCNLTFDASDSLRALTALKLLDRHVDGYGEISFDITDLGRRFLASSNVHNIPNYVGGVIDVASALIGSEFLLLILSGSNMISQNTTIVVTVIMFILGVLDSLVYGHVINNTGLSKKTFLNLEYQCNGFNALDDQFFTKLANIIDYDAFTEYV